MKNITVFNPRRMSQLEARGTESSNNRSVKGRDKITKMAVAYKTYFKVLYVSGDFDFTFKMLFRVCIEDESISVSESEISSSLMSDAFFFLPIFKYG